MEPLSRFKFYWNRSSTRLCFVEMETEAENAAIDLDGAEWMGRNQSQ